MRQKHFILYLVLFFIPITGITQSKNITLEDIWVKGTFRPNYFMGVNWMKDNNFFTRVDYNPYTNTANILKSNIQTGESQILVEGTSLIPEGATQPIEFEDYSFSPDETKMLLTSETEPIYRRSYKTNYFLYDLSSRKLKKLTETEGKQAYATFSPDGQKVGFVRNNNIFYVDLKTGLETQVTTDGKINAIINGSTDWVYEEEFEFTQAFFWSPDSKTIAYYRFDETGVKDYTMQIWEGLYPQNYVYKYPKAGTDNSKVEIKLYDVESKKTNSVGLSNDKDFYIPRIKWTNDPSVLAILKLNRLQNHLQIFHVNRLDFKSKVVYEENNNTYIEVSDHLLTYLPANKGFLISSEKDGFRHIYYYDPEGKLINQVTKGNWEVAEFSGFDQKNNLVYYLSTEDTPLETHLYSVKLDGTENKKLTQLKGTHEVELSPDYLYALDYYSTINKPTNVNLLELPSGKQLSTLMENGQLEKKLKEYKISPVEFFSFETSEGTALNGYMIKPSDFNKKKKYPVLLFVYGGPGSQQVKDSWFGSNYLWFQMLAQEGYVVVSIDNRGTGGRGADFKKMTQNQLGKYETVDLIETAKYLGSKSFIDKDRIGIFGWSYGGYLASLAMTVGADFFKTGIAVAPVTNWRFYDTIYTERFLGLPQQNPEGYDNNSPLNHAEKLKGNYLLIHGTADDNVHVQNSMEMEKALIKANKHYEVFYYPDKNHGIYGGNTRYHLYQKMTDFLKRKL